MRSVEDWLRSFRLKKGLHELNDLKGWRSYALDLMLTLSLIALPIGYLATFPHFISQGNYGIVIFDTFVYLLLLVSYFNYDQFPRGISFFFVLYILVIAFFMHNGPFYARPGWLVLCTVIASLLFGVRGAVITSLVNGLLLMVMYWLVGPHLHAWVPVYADPMSKWIMFMVNITLISLVAGLPVSLLLDRLDFSFTHERDLRSRLLDEGEELKTANASLQAEIAERLRMEAELRKSEEKYRGLYGDALVGIFQTTPDGRFLNLNRAFAQMFGYESPEEMMAIVTSIGSQLYSSEGERGRLVKYLEKHGRYEGYGSPAICKDGSLKWIMLKIHVVRDEAGQISCYEGTALDITEQKEAEKALRESDESLRRITENMLDLLCEVDAQARFKYISPSFKGILGYAPEDLVGESVFDRVHPDDLEHVTDKYQKGLTLRTSSEVEYRFRHADGRYVWLLSVGNPLINDQGKFTGAVVTGRDITDRKQAEDALRESEERYRIIAENARDVIWIFDLSFGYVFVSPAVMRLRGFTVEEALKQKLEDILTPESYKIAITFLTEGLSLEMKGERHTQEWSITSDLEMVRKDGSTVWTEVTLNLLYNEDGTVRGIMGITRDISERRKAEEEKKALEHQLIQAQKMESMGTLAGGIAHDFNNILSAIIGYAELSRLHIPEESQARGYVEQVLSAGIRAKGLVQQILSFSRHSMQEMKPVRVGAVMEEALQLLRATIPSTVEIRAHIEEAGCVLSDPAKIHQILMNLCTNASHAMDMGGGVLDVALHRECVDGEAQAQALGLAPGDYLRITVADTGHGIPPEVMDRIFEPYFTTKERGRGTGLGLAVIHSIVKNHNGAVHCSSTPGRGTAFDVYLPEVKAQAPAGEPAQEKELSTGTERILFIDDEEPLRDVGKIMLESLGYTVTAMTSPAEALDTFGNDPSAFDLVMTDMTMPGMTGDLLARRLMEIRVGVPIILCTGYSEHISPEKAHLMGIREYIMKPLELKALSRVLRKALERR